MRMRTQISATIAAGLLFVAAGLLTAGCQTIKDASSGAGQAIGEIGSRLTGGRVRSDQIQTAVEVANTLALDQSEEEAFGQTLAIKLSQKPGYVDDAQLTAYVQKVGLTVSGVCEREHLDFVFGVLKDETVNAVSGPYGYVFVTRGLLRACRDESELAGVLAHEIAHVAKGHGLSAVKQAGLTRAGLKVAASQTPMASLADLSSKAADKLIAGVYSQGQEDEADRLAVQYCRAARYDPAGLARLLERAYAGKGATVFSSHPSTVDRVGRIRAAAAGGAGQSLAARYAANVKL